VLVGDASGVAAAPVGCLREVPSLLRCLPVACLGMVVVPGELLLELLLGVGLGRELVAAVPVLLPVVCSTLAVARLLVVDVVAFIDGVASGRRCCCGLRRGCQQWGACCRPSAFVSEHGNKQRKSLLQQCLLFAFSNCISQ